MGYHTGTIEGSLRQTWQDKRRDERTAAANKTAALRRKMVRAAASRSRKDAIERGRPTYIGSPCPRHPTHVVRYVSGGSCTICAALRADDTRRRAGTYRGRRFRTRGSGGNALVIEGRTLRELAMEAGISLRAMRARFHRGWTVEQLSGGPGHRRKGRRQGAPVSV